MAGPGIRYWNFANVLSQTFDVTLFTPNNCSLDADFRIEQMSKKAIKECLRSGSGQLTSVIVQGMTLWNHPYLKRFNIPIVVDLYDPFIFENIELFNDDAQLHRSSLSILLDQLMVGDYFICASDKQKDFWLGMLSTINRINPIEYRKNKAFDHLISVVPFGISSDTPTQDRNVLKGVIEGIGLHDNVILWGGGLWDWLDPLTAVQGMKVLSERRDDVKLFFMGVKPPNPALVQMENVEKTMELSDALGLTGKYVFFNSWVEYRNRHNYLLESDIGINLHYNHIETRFAYRTRMLDYIWCQLPIVTTEGDVLSALVETYQLGRTIKPEDPNDFADAVEHVLTHKMLYQNKSSDLLREMTWETSLTALISFCQEPTISLGKSSIYKVRGLL